MIDGAHLDHDPKRAVPVLLHGDAAFPGQGVVAETFNLQALDGYATGGTIHIIQNNQVGFTTDPEDARSTPYAADMAKGFNVPIVHVNADDVEACSGAVRLAMAYRERWGRDIVIDVIGYRRYGHNETDEPAYTQPQMAAKIKAHPPVSEIYAEKLISEGVVSAEDVKRDQEERRGGAQRDPEGAAGEDGAGRLRGPDRDHDRDRRARPHRQPPGGHCGPRGEAALAERAPDRGPGELHHPPQAPQAAAEAAGGDRRGRDRVRARREPRLRLAADRGRPHPPHRPGHRARHLLAPPSRPPRREDRARVLPDEASRGRDRAVRALQQPALGGRLPRLRVRLLGRQLRTRSSSGRRSSATSPTPPR